MPPLPNEITGSKGRHKAHRAAFIPSKSSGREVKNTHHQGVISGMQQWGRRADTGLSHGSHETNPSTAWGRHQGGLIYLPVKSLPYILHLSGQVTSEPTVCVS